MDFFAEANPLTPRRVHKDLCVVTKWGRAFEAKSVTLGGINKEGTPTLI